VLGYGTDMEMKSGRSGAVYDSKKIVMGVVKMRGYKSIQNLIVGGAVCLILNSIVNAADKMVVLPFSLEIGRAHV
jgi:hypothetical protein